MIRDLDRLPGSHQLHRWSDWAELLCLASESGELSISDLAEAAHRRNDARDVESTEDSEDGDDSEAIKGKTDPELSDAQQAKAQEAFAICVARQNVFSDAYPFHIDSVNTLRLRPESSARSFYLFLLLCSTLRYAKDGAVQTKLTGRFEGVALDVVRRLMPPPAQVHLFGKNSELTNGRYTGKLAVKLSLLIKDLGEEVRFKIDDFSPKDMGDNGLDIVAWMPMGDPLGGRPIIFGQCACTPQWVSKQHSSSAAAFSGVMSQTVRPINMCFIPFDFRGVDGSWYKRPSVQESVLVDRRRIMALLGMLGDDEKGREAAAAAWQSRLDFERINETRGLLLQDL